MRDGEKVKLIGDNGNPFVTTVGTPFSAEYIAERVSAGAWKWPTKAPAKRAARKR